MYSFCMKFFLIPNLIINTLDIDHAANKVDNLKSTLHTKK